jgi:hypothetical protein
MNMFDKNNVEICTGDTIIYNPFNYGKTHVVECPDITAFHWWDELERMLEDENKCEIEVLK